MRHYPDRRLVSGGTFIFWFCVYLTALHVISLITAEGPGPCILGGEIVNGQQTAQQSRNNDCPTLIGGARIFAESFFRIVETHDKIIIALFTLILGISTIGLWITTRRLWIAQEHQIRVARVAFEQTNRAYISVRPRGLHLTSEGEWVAHIVIKNVGKFPSKHTCWVIQKKYSPDKREQTLAIDHGELEGDIAVQPSATLLQGSERIKIHGKPSAGTSEYLYIFGLVSYEDGMGQRRETFFCHRYNLINNNGGSIDKIYARYHRYGNTAT